MSVWRRVFSLPQLIQAAFLVETICQLIRVTSVSGELMIHISRQEHMNEIRIEKLYIRKVGLALNAEDTEPGSSYILLGL